MPATVLKKTPTQVFYCEPCEMLKSTYSEEHLRTTDSAYLKSKLQLM